MPCAWAFGLPTPKGVLIIGVPGTGKSLTAKVTAKALGVPLLKLDAGRIYGGWSANRRVTSEQPFRRPKQSRLVCFGSMRLRRASAAPKALAPPTGGTSARVFGTLLNWMQEKTAPVFIVATANDVSQLPPEFLRKGRWDEMFFVDLPNAIERRAIWEIQIAKYGRVADGFDLDQLARATDGLTGSEIEAVFTEALTTRSVRARNRPTYRLHRSSRRLFLYPK